MRSCSSYCKIEGAKLAGAAAPREKATWLSPRARLDVPRDDLGRRHHCGRTDFRFDLDSEIPSLWRKLNPGRSHPNQHWRPTARRAAKEVKC
jgi:hypothetical protein